jgi:hypothetical protein|tara:strand:+ start:152 stop:565 length:414 start_codon:yes stop_codon:yes gene_type:complete
MSKFWTYKGKPVKELPEWCAGFVYEITNTHNGKKYIGKKLAKFKRSRRPLKGRVNKRRYTIPSDWQDYFGSSNALLEDVDKIGKEKFKREILFYCKNRGECNYIEAREQFARKVLETDKYYNGHIRVRVHKQVLPKD